MGNSAFTFRHFRPICLPLAALLVTAACATPPPPRQLLDARAAYDKARNGQAAKLTPADLHTAKVKLNEADKSYEEEPESAQTFALSYVALRQAQLVDTLANTKAAEKDLEASEKELNRLREADMARTKGDLARARQQLSAQGQKLAVTDERLASSKQQLEASAAQLEEERKARLAAEERERLAMQKLAAAAALSVKEEKRGTVIVLPGSVLFASGKYELTSGARHKLTLVAGTLAPQSETHNILVEGHTDSRGGHASNMLLSENRARVVMEFMISQGVQASALSSVGIGPDRPMSDNSTREGRAQNRRVEIIVKRVEPR